MRPRAEAHPIGSNQPRSQRIARIVRAFATRASSFRVVGGGASASTHRARLPLAVLLAALLLTIALGSNPAFAAARPEIDAEPTAHVVTQTSASAFNAFIGSNGAETHWNFEYSTGADGPWSPVPGGSGSVPAGYANGIEAGTITGLNPETIYYLQVVATNAVGTVSKIGHFETVPRHPQSEPPRFSDVTETSVNLQARLNPDNFETHWHFEYATSRNGPWKDGADGTILASEANEEFQLVEESLTNLSPSTSYYVRLFAENQYGEATSPFELIASGETAGPPAATTFADHLLQGEAPRVLGSVEPHGYDTHYHFEYVTQAQFEAGGFAGVAATPELDAGGGGEDESSGEFQTKLVGANLPALQAGTTYHFRLLVTSDAPGNPVVTGSEQTLTMPARGPAEEPACPNQALREGASQALPDCRAYEQVTPTEKEGAQDIFNYGGSVEGELAGEDGDHFLLHGPGVQWGANPDPSASNYFFSRSSDGWQMTSARPQGEAGPDTYRPQIFNSDLTQIGLELGWETTLESSISPDLEFELGPPGGPYAIAASIPRSEQTSWVALTDDGGMGILQTDDHRLLGHSTGTTSGDDLYAFSKGALRQVNVLGGSPGSPVSACGAKLANGDEGYQEGQHSTGLSSPHAVSADGSHVFFEDSCTHHLYARVDGSETIDIGAYVFLGANAEGTELLLEKQTGETREVVLYITGSATTKSLFATHGMPAGLMVSEDLGAIYFSSTEQLTPEAPPVQSSGLNLYRYDISAEKLQFVVQSAAALGAGVNDSFVSPDGRYYYWESHEVGGFATTFAGGAQTTQVYRYDSAERVVQCMSCASPFDPEPKLNAAFLEKGVVNSDDGAPNLTAASANGDYVFFMTPAALVPEDVDGEVEPEEHFNDENLDYSERYSVSTDVYEWRKDGVDGCGHIQGCLALISSGRGGHKVMLFGTTPSGGDVFFGTHESLVPQDQDSAGDVYDARIGGGFQPPPPRPVECEGDACSTPASPPSDVTPSSLTFSGAGSLIPVPATKPAVKSKKAKARKKVKWKRAGKDRDRHGKAKKSSRRSRR